MNAPSHTTPPERHDQSGGVELFAAQVAHDLNNLLTGILGNLELMQGRARRQGHTDYDGYLESAQHAGARAALFAQRLLAFAGTAADDAAIIDLNSAIREAAEHVPTTSLTFELTTPIALLCDATQAVRAVTELLDNAVTATAAAGGTITLRTRRTGDVAELIVADTGCGMAPEIAARATEAFFSTHPNGAGKGLGLPIVANFARQAGGCLRIESFAGAGTTATLILPVHRP
jgi:signal transduction histidine kinase